MKTTISRTLSLVALTSLPFLAAAQTTSGSPTDNGSGTPGCQLTDIASVFNCGLSLINDYVVPIVFAIAFIVFIIGIYRYFIAGGGNEEKVKEGRSFLVWSIIGFVIMFSLWGIVNIFVHTFGLDNQNRPSFPTFNSTTNSSPGTTPSPNGSTQTPGQMTSCPAGEVVQNGGCVPFSQQQGLQHT